MEIRPGDRFVRRNVDGALPYTCLSVRDGKVKLWRFNPLTQANESITLYVSFFRAHYRAVEEDAHV